MSCSLWGKLSLLSVYCGGRAWAWAVSEEQLMHSVLAYLKVLWLCGKEEQMCAFLWS